MKFPINQLLYVVILGLLGASGWQFWETYQEISKPTTNRQQTVNETTTKLMEQGRSQKADRKGMDYTTEKPWGDFRDANLIGKVPPPPEIDKPEEEPEPLETPETPLEDICSVMCLVFNGEQSYVVIRYQETAGVEPPSEVLEGRERVAAAAAAKPAQPSKNKPRSTRPRPNRRPQPVMPRANGLDGWTHIVDLEEKLWKPFDHIRLVRIDEEANYAEFVRAKDGGEEGEPERLFKDELQMGQDLLAALDRMRNAEGAADNGGEARIAEPTGSNVWRGGDMTQRIGRDYHIGRKDWQSWNEDPQRILNQEVGTRSYSRGGTKGVQVTKVSPRMQQFGVVSGDVITAINGEPVSSKAAAIKVGKRLYKRGVRSFEVTVLTRGREVTRTYVAPEKR